MDAPFIDPIDIFKVSDACLEQYFIKDDVMTDISDGIYTDAIRLLDYDRDHATEKVLRGAKMGNGENLWTDDKFRGDRACWVTPNLCRDLQLNNFELFVKRLIRECKIFRRHPCFGLNGDFSVQFAVYVSYGQFLLHHS